VILVKMVINIGIPWQEFVHKLSKYQLLKKQYPELNYFMEGNGTMGTYGQCLNSLCCIAAGRL
jgi:formate-dependent nitrite reductase cytochrome c552 subunit